jgi:hypothetical protein
VELAEVVMRLSGEGPLKDGEGFFFVTQGTNRIVVRGMVSQYRLDVNAHIGSECTVVFVGATLTQEPK